MQSGAFWALKFSKCPDSILNNKCWNISLWCWQGPYQLRRVHNLSPKWQHFLPAAKKKLKQSSFTETQLKFTVCTLGAFVAKNVGFGWQNWKKWNKRNLSHGHDLKGHSARKGGGGEASAPSAPPLKPPMNPILLIGSWCEGSSGSLKPGVPSLQLLCACIGLREHQRTFSNRPLWRWTEGTKNLDRKTKIGIKTLFNKYVCYRIIWL